MSKVIPKSPLAVEWVSIDLIVENPHNSRIHKPAQIEKIAASVRANGIIQPLLTDESYNLMAGHGRLASFKLL